MEANWSKFKIYKTGKPSLARPTEMVEQMFVYRYKLCLRAIVQPLIKYERCVCNELTSQSMRLKQLHDLELPDCGTSLACNDKKQQGVRSSKVNTCCQHVTTYHALPCNLIQKPPRFWDTRDQPRPGSQSKKLTRSLTRGCNVSSFSSAHVRDPPCWQPDNSSQATRNIMAKNQLGSLKWL